MMNEGKESGIIRTAQKVFDVRTLIVAGSLLLTASAFIGWMDRPVVGWLRGVAITLSDSAPPFLSYGALSFLAGIASLAAIPRRLRWMSLAAGTFGLLLALHFFFSFALIERKGVLVVADLNEQQKNILAFGRYLPPNIGTEPTFDASVSADTIADRLSASFHFVAFGWYSVILGSLVLLLAFMKSGGEAGRRRLSLCLPPALVLTYAAFVISPYVSAEHHRTQGDEYSAKGMYARAIDEYGRARAIDKNVKYLKGFHYSLGKAHFFSGRSGGAEYSIYRGFLAQKEKDFPLAIYSFTAALSADPSLESTVGKGLLSWTYVTYGLYEYQSGRVASAIDLWRKSVETDPSQIQSYYYLSRAYYDVGSYEQSIIAGLQFLRLAENKIMKANVSANIADAYHRLKIFDSARAHYLRSLFLDKYQNLRAVMSLVGR